MDPSWDMKSMSERSITILPSSKSLKERSWSFHKTRFVNSTSCRKKNGDKSWDRPPKTNMEPNNWWFVDVSPLPRGYFQVPCLLLGVYGVRFDETKNGFCFRFCFRSLQHNFAHLTVA